MREIIFRGKRRGNGEGVYGWPFADTADCSLKKAGKCVCPHDGSKYFIVEWVDDYHEYEERQVIPNTVGQYTGSKDKNGKRIFEGDIVRHTFDSPDDPTATENGLKVRTGRIFWSDWRASFAVTAGRNLSATLNNDVAFYVRGRQVYEYVRGANTVEVIGNIHDDPELIKEEAQP